MKYVQGHTHHEYKINGRVIPKNYYTESERKAGRVPVLKVEDAEWAEIASSNLIQYLIEHNEITVSNEAPMLTETKQDVLESLEAAKARIAELEAGASGTEELDAAKARIAELEAGSSGTEELDAAKARIAELETANSGDMNLAAVAELRALAEDTNTKKADLVAGAIALAELLGA